MTVEQHQTPTTSEIILPARGFLVGLGAALAMAVVAMTGFALAGRGLWTPLNAIGSLFGSGDSPLSGDFVAGASLLGATIHLLLGGLLGVLYASAQERIDNPSLIIIAIYYGLVIWVVSNFAVLSWLKPSLHEVMRTWPLLLGHLAYGAVLGLYAASRNRSY